MLQKEIPTLCVVANGDRGVRDSTWNEIQHAVNCGLPIVVRQGSGELVDEISASAAAAGKLSFIHQFPPPMLTPSTRVVKTACGSQLD